MSNFFYLYPTLNSTHMLNAEISYTNLDFYFSSKSSSKLTGVVTRTPIKYDESSQHLIELNDEHGLWNASYDDLEISQKLAIKYPNQLFGDFGISSVDSTIGVAILWYSKESRQRGSIPIGDFNSKSNEVDFKVNAKFINSQLTSKIDYSVVLYVKDYDEESTNNNFADDYGLILGTIFTSTIILEGDESSFPVVSIESDEKPLWSLYCEWGELEELFKDCIVLRLNKSHPDYKWLDLENGKHYNQPLFKQILVNVVSIIIDTAKNKNQIDSLLNGDDFYLVGSMGYLIKYYIETYQVNYDTTSTIYETVMNGVW